MRIAIAGGTGTVGRHVVDTSEDNGHETVVLSRSAGIDLADGTGLDAALDGVDTVIDVASMRTWSAKASEEFFRTVTTNLLAAEVRAGVGHQVALTIVGSAQAPWGYYAGKVVQEEFVTHGPVPWTLQPTWSAPTREPSGRRVPFSLSRCPASSARRSATAP